MATFAISYSVEVEAESYEEAYTIQNRLRGEINSLQDVYDVCDIDVELLEGELEEE